MSFLLKLHLKKCLQLQLTSFKFGEVKITFPRWIPISSDFCANRLLSDGPTYPASHPATMSLKGIVQMACDGPLGLHCSWSSQGLLPRLHEAYWDSVTLRWDNPTKHRAWNPATPYKGWPSCHHLCLTYQSSRCTCSWSLTEPNFHLSPAGTHPKGKLPLTSCSILSWCLQNKCQPTLNDKLFYFEYFLLSLNNIIFRAWGSAFNKHLSDREGKNILGKTENLRRMC